MKVMKKTVEVTKKVVKHPETKRWFIRILILAAEEGLKIAKNQIEKR